METKELAKAYEPKGVEDKWYAAWLEMKAFAADPASKKPPYSIVIPPPNITGVLTMGHVLNNTLQDILVRRKHMQGFEVLWLPGTDHAGIATQTVVERMLRKEGKHRDDLGREEFVKRVWEWKDKHGGIIIKQLKKLGCACDWEREVFTMDGLDARRGAPPRAPATREGTEPLPYKIEPRVNYSACVQKVFVDLYKKGLIYRGLKMVNWCPVSRTALSDEEVVMKETDGHLWHFRYPIISDSRGAPQRAPAKREGTEPLPYETSNYIIVATTRPETMLGDEAIAVNPKDKRYKDLVGRKVLLPLQNKPIPIIADEAVELGFGTGAVKVTPAHDPVDYDIGLRHTLPITVVIGPNGVMTEAAGEKFEGLDRFECRKAVVVDMQELGLLEKTENYKHNVGFSQRADVPIEPYLSEQWFLKYPAVKEALKAVEKGTIKFWPSRWTKVYSHWLKGIRDWCISRQLWWGHRIPAWYCVTAPLLCTCPPVVWRKEGKGEVENLPHPNPPLTKGRDCPPIVSIERPAKCPHCGGTEFTQENDVLDTWFSSWLWPFATMGWPNKTPELKKFYPTSDLVTGPDIIFFWVARMIMAGFEFMGEKPFSNVYFTGIIRDSQGRKMSKSLGNSPDPLDLIDKYGADGLRFGLMLIAPKGQDILFSEDRVEVGRNFMNKLWNASRFVMMNTTLSPTPPPEGEGKNLSLADKWILNRLQHTIKDVNAALDHYQFDTAAHALYQFVWGDFCDWYLELSKTQMPPNKVGEGTEPLPYTATQHVLLHVLDNILRMLHPFAPFITEEIWQMVKTPLLCKEGKGEVDSSTPPQPSPYKGEGVCATILRADYPAPPKKIEHAKEAHEMQAIMDVISAIRNIRGEHNVAPGKQIDVILRAHKKEVHRMLEKDRNYLITLCRISKLDIVEGHLEFKKCATAVAGDVDIFIPLAGMIDLSAEKTRLTKEIERIGKYSASLEQKLSNKNFVERAPKDVVDAERAKLSEIKTELGKLKGALLELGE